jgi:histone deacetylase complex regulatory component SIN3
MAKLPADILAEFFCCAGIVCEDMINKNRMAERIYFMLRSSTKLFNSFRKVLSFNLPKIGANIFGN